MPAACLPRSTATKTSSGDRTWSPPLTRSSTPAFYRRWAQAVDNEPQSVIESTVEFRKKILAGFRRHRHGLRVHALRPDFGLIHVVHFAFRRKNCLLLDHVANDVAIDRRKPHHRSILREALIRQPPNRCLHRGVDRRIGGARAAHHPRAIPIAQEDAPQRPSELHGPAITTPPPRRVK